MVLPEVVSEQEQLYRVVKRSNAARFCYQIEAEIKSAPTEFNPYHANIFLDRSSEQKRNLQALKLADHCTTVFYDNSVQWLQLD